MSIVAYTGLPGSGKSYGVVENVIVPALASGRTIYTNIPLKVGTLADEYPSAKIVSFNTREVGNDYFDLEKHGAGAIWVIDECQHFWPSGLKQNLLPENIISFFTEHRHFVGDDGMTTEIVLVTQDLQQACSFVRNLVEETYRATKLTAIGQKNKYRVDVFMGAAIGQKPSKDKLVRQLFGTYKQDIYRFYKSHTKNKTDFAAGMEEKADDRANVLKHPLIKIGIPLALFFMVYGTMKVLAYFNRGVDDHKEPEQATQVQTLKNNVTAENNVNKYVKNNVTELQKYQLSLDISQEGLPVSDRYRIVGKVGRKFLIASENGDRVIHDSLCTMYTNTYEDYCVIGGQLVTWYSWKRPVQPDEDRKYKSAFEKETIM